MRLMVAPGAWGERRILRRIVAWRHSSLLVSSLVWRPMANKMPRHSSDRRSAGVLNLPP